MSELLKLLTKIRSSDFNEERLPIPLKGRKEAYYATFELVQRRLQKAKSVRGFML